MTKNKKIITCSYVNVKLKINNLESIINILTVINMNQALQLGHNSLSNIFLIKKDIYIFLTKDSEISIIVINNKIFILANIIENQYII